MGLPGGGRNKRDTNRIGEISETAIIIRFLQLGYVVLTPYGGNQRYDLVIEDVNGQFWRIQCKSARTNVKGTVLSFNASICNVTGKNRQSRNYRGQCDYFAAYWEKCNKVYLIPVDQISTTVARLQLVQTKSNHQKDVQWAQDYEL